MKENEMSVIDAETRDMINSFVSEAFDSLDTNEPIVEHLRLDNNNESVNAIFRVFHTLKGLSGFFEMKVINKVTHEAETLLDVIRKQNSVQTEETISVIYQTFDFLRNLLQTVNSTFTDKGAESDADDMILVLKDCLDKVQNRTKVDEIINEGGQDKEFSFDFSEVADDIIENDKIDDEANLEAEEFYSENQQDDTADNLLSGDMLDQYLTSANELLDTAENDLLVLERNPDNPALVGETFGAIHSLKGNSGFMGFSEIEEISIEMETILDSVRSKELDIDQTVVSVLLSNIEAIRNRLKAIKDKNNSKLNKGEFISQPTPKIVKRQSPEKPAEVNLSGNNIKFTDKPDNIETKDNKTDRAADKPMPPALASLQKKDIRVETTKIDKLFDLVGELITIESMVSNNIDLQGMELPNFTKSANMLNKITRELQEIAMSVRMMPLDGLFNKMKRLVRDVSIKMEKKVDFFISGQDTEMDKNVIDEIADPLVHILRNSIDHGIESPEERIAEGKPETGRVSLSARYEGNEILIIIEDDGHGIARDKVLNKAIEKNLLTVAPEKMSDKDVFMLIFEPGFSTAEKVTDISGRGVGMDVAKKNIEKLHGSIDINSKLGYGSTFTLRIPLTLAIMEAMLIRIGDSKFALPILAIKESFRTNNSKITKTMDGLEVVKIRDEVLPVIRLHELFDRIPDSEDLSKGILIVIESRRKSVALFVDEIVGQQQAVIKGLSDYIGKVPGITGCMIIGDGSIGLILDIESLIELAEDPLFSKNNIPDNTKGILV